MNEEKTTKQISIEESLVEIALQIMSPDIRLAHFNVTFEKLQPILDEKDLQIKKLEEENKNLRAIISKELSENDEFGAEFVMINILKEKIRAAMDKLNE